MPLQAQAANACGNVAVAVIEDDIDPSYFNEEYGWEDRKQE
jgi:hypothetical protein